jgi:tetratricopeptide (TPR) repeat protein
MAERVLERDPTHTGAMLALGIVSAKSGALEEAEHLLTRVAERDQESFPARIWLSFAMRRAHRIEEAIRWATVACRLEPNDPEALAHLGACHLDARQFDEAARCFEAARRIAPDSALVWHGAAKASEGLGNGPLALQQLKRAAELQPDSPEILLALVQACSTQLENLQAIRYATRLVRLAPESPLAHLELARTLLEENRLSEAQEHLDRAIALGPADGPSYAVLGNLLQSLGRMDEAVHAFAKSIEIQPRQSAAYLGICQSRSLSSSDRPMIDRMADLAAAGDLSQSNLMLLDYGLGKAHEDLGGFERAMGHYDEANRIAYRSKFGEGPFDQAGYADQFTRVIETFTPDLLANLTTSKGPDLPILVVGMLRSGTTLTEQILSSHPDVASAGERTFWPNHRSDEPGTDLEALADDYRRGLRWIAPGATHVVDKMPDNYSMLGLIHMALPNARIIHVSRDPIDTCLSIYITPIRNHIGWLHDKANIVFAYREYLRLMAHWRSVLPGNRLLDVRYEDLVNDRETVTRRMIEFCGLPWRDECLRPEENRRHVVNPSFSQVRQAVHTRSIGRWRRYEPWLGPLGELLDPLDS